MTLLLRVVCGALLGSLLFVTALAAQMQPIVSIPDLFSGVGMAAGVGALISLGTYKEKVETHGSRLTKLETDRVTRSEFTSMDGTIQNIQNDVRQVREMLERRSRPRD